jgi:pimeloyl-ACP methyl ester carboxylesterase
MHHDSVKLERALRHLRRKPFSVRVAAREVGASPTNPHGITIGCPQIMSVAQKMETDRFRTSGRGAAFYFDSGDHKLFGWLHQPPRKTVARTGLVICKPFGYEAICSHSSLRAFAEASAAVGVPCLQFDYLGTGDSADISPQADQLKVWTDDVLAAISELQRHTGVERVILFGIRLGALLATLASRQSKSAAGLILVAPVISGRRYLRELRMARLAAAMGARSADSEKTPNTDDQATHDRSMEASGFSLSAATVAALELVDLTAPHTPSVPEMLIIDGSSAPAARTWAESLSALSSQTQYLVLPGLIEMLMTAPQYAKIPEAMVAATREWLLRFQGGSPGLPDTDNSQPPNGSSIPSTTAMLLAGNAPETDAVLTERPVFLGSEALIFGIVTEPRQGEMRRRAVILLNAGGTYHVGPNRMHVMFARHWAQSGYVVMRMDLSGLGDSGTRTGRPDNEVFPPAALDDMRAAIDFIRTHYGIEDITLGGLCSGAYHALRAAVAAIPVNRILMINPENFIWKEGTKLDDLQVAEVIRKPGDYRERMFSISAWKRMMSGQVNILRIINIFIRRPLLALESEVRNLARRLHVRLPRDLGWELQEIAARGVRIVFVFARGEAGIDLLKIEAGSSLKPLGDRCRVHVIGAESADHIFSQTGPRAALERILSEELFAPNQRHGSASGPRETLATVTQKKSPNLL